MRRPGDPPREHQARAAQHDRLAAEARELLDELDSEMQWRRPEHEGARDE